MCGGGSLWEPGEFTDDTQMALLVASSLVDRGGLDEADLFDRFRTWAKADPKDVGIQTRAVLGSGQPWDVAAAEHFRRTGPRCGQRLADADDAGRDPVLPGRARGHHGRRPADLGADARRPVHRRGLRDLPRADAGGPRRRRPAGGDPLGAGGGRRRAPGSVGGRAGAGLDAGGRHRVERRGLADARPGGVGAAPRLATSPT